MFEWKDGRWRKPLLIDPHLGEIVDLSEKNQVIIVHVPTGGGKTTRIDQAAYLANPRLRIIQSQTLRNAVRWNTKRVAWEMGSSVGALVGYRLSGERVVSKATRITFMIDRSISNMIRRAGGRLPEGLIIIDEAHERTVNIDLALGLIKEALPNSPNTRVIIASATIDAEKFSAFFGGVPIVAVPGQSQHVRVEPWQIDARELRTDGVARAACSVMERFLREELHVPTANGTSTEVAKSGTVLVLLPGKGEIEQVIARLRHNRELLQAGESVEILTCHGETTPEEQDRCQRPLKPGTLRIVCGTEILRQSVTVEDTMGVIDSLRVKRFVMDPKGVGHLDTIPESRQRADQGKGRIRTRPGFYMPVVDGDEFEKLPAEATPTILQEPSTNVALQIAAVGQNIRTFPLLDRPDPERIEVAIKRLQRIGALDENEHITDIGDMLADLPMDPERAKALFTAQKLGVLGEAIIATAILETEDIFHRPRSSKERIVADEQLLRLILSRMEKYYGGWRMSESRAIDPAQVDLKELPEWVNRLGDLYEVHCESEIFPHKDGAQWVAKLVRRNWAGTSGSDFAAMVRAYRAFKAEERTRREVYFQRRDERRNGHAAADDSGKKEERVWEQMRGWCFRWFLNHKRIGMMEQVLDQILDELHASPLRLAESLTHDRAFDEAALTKALASGLTDHVGLPDGAPKYKGALGSFELSRQSICPESSGLVLVSEVRKVPLQRKLRDGREFLYFADAAAPLKPEWLVEVMPQLCSFTRAGGHCYSRTQDAVVELEVVKYLDLKISERWVPVADETATKTFLRAILAGYVSGDRATALKAEADKVKAESTELWARTSGEFAKVTDDQIVAAIVSSLAGRMLTIQKELEATPISVDAIHSLIDRDLAKTVTELFPNSVNILGVDREVMYQYTEAWYSTPAKATATVQFTVDEAEALQEEDLKGKIPGGTPVTVKLSDEHYTGIASESPLALRVKIRERAQNIAWGKVAYSSDAPWKSTGFDKTEITIGQELPVLPEPVQYGEYRGLVFFAHPARTIYDTRDNGRYSVELTWHHTQLDAEKVDAKARDIWASLCDKFNRGNSLQNLQQKAKGLQSTLRSLEARKDFSTLERELRRKVERKNYSTPPADLENLRTWVTEAEAIIAEVEAALK